jgi:hypothetical protein
MNLVILSNAKTIFKKHTLSMAKTIPNIPQIKYDAA